MAPLIIAHRGGAPQFGENSAAAFESGLQIGADMLEMDVQRSADGELIVLHDDSVLLPQGRRVPVSKLTVDALRAAYPSLMLLDDFLERYATKMRTNIDLKGVGFESDLIERLRRHGLVERVLISGTFWRSLRTIKLLAPDARCGLSRGQFVSWLGREPHSTIAAEALRPTLSVQLVAHARLALADAVMLQYRLIRPWLVRYLHARGLQVYCWTVNDPIVARDLAAAGVDGIASDDPGLLVERLRL